MRIDILVSMVVGAIGGAILGSLGTHVVESKKYMEQLETEVSQIKRSTEAKESQDKSEIAKSEPVVEVVEPEKTQEKSEFHKATEDINQYRDKVSIYSEEKTPEEKKKDLVNYSLYSTPPKDDENKKSKQKVQKPKDKPYLITDEEYYNTLNGQYDKRKATWWARSHELVDEDDTALDAEMTVGMESLTAWPDEGVIWVRNPSLAADYEVIFCDSEYDYNLY